MKNRDLWSKVCVRENGVINREKTIDALDTFMALLANDQEKVGEVIETVLREAPKFSHLAAPILIHSVCSRIAPNDFAQWADLGEVAKEVLAANYKSEKGQGRGVVNPFYVKPAEEKAEEKKSA